MDKTILTELEEAIRTKNASWIRELAVMIQRIADDLERQGAK